MSVASLLILCSSFLAISSVAVAIIHHRDLPEEHMNVVSWKSLLFFLPDRLISKEALDASDLITKFSICVACLCYQFDELICRQDCNLLSWIWRIEYMSDRPLLVWAVNFSGPHVIFTCYIFHGLITWILLAVIDFHAAYFRLKGKNCGFPNGLCCSSGVVLKEKDNDVNASCIRNTTLLFSAKNGLWERLTL